MIQEIPWYKGPILGWDTETTGIDPTEARLVSSGMVLDDPLTGRQWVRNWLANPGIEIPLEATAVHGISTEEAQTKGEEPKKVIVETLRAFELVRQEYGQIPLVIFNAAYDLTILDRELGRQFGSDHVLDIQLPIVDPFVIDKGVDKFRSGRRTLTAIAASYGVAIKGAHTAEGDVITSIKLARALGSKYSDNIGAFDLYTFLQPWQIKAHRYWTAHYQEYRRNSGDFDFTCSGHWPYQPRNAVTVSRVSDGASPRLPIYVGENPL
jgi:DNA polymerase-3 subunit epsilon